MAITYPLDPGNARLVDASTIPAGEFFLLPEEGKFTLAVNIVASRNHSSELRVVVRLNGPNAFDVLDVPRHRSLRAVKVLPLGIRGDEVRLSVRAESRAVRVADEKLPPGSIAFTDDAGPALAVRWKDVQNPEDVSVVYARLANWELDGHPYGALAVDSWTLHRAHTGAEERMTLIERNA